MTHDSGRSPLNFDLSADSPMGGRPLGPNMARDEDTPLGSQLSSAFSAPSLKFEEVRQLHIAAAGDLYTVDSAGMCCIPILCEPYPDASWGSSLSSTRATRLTCCAALASVSLGRVVVCT